MSENALSRVPASRLPTPIARLIEKMVVLMSNKPKQAEVLFEIVDGVEYATLRADDFRNAMNERDDLRNVVKAKIELAAKLVEQALADEAKIERLRDQMIKAIEQGEHWYQLWAERSAQVERLQVERKPVTCTACNGWHSDGECPERLRSQS